MKTLLLDLMNWFQMTGYRKASFDRLLGILEHANNYNEMNELISEYPQYLRSATMKGGFPGVALLENVYPYRVLQELGSVNVAATPSTPYTFPDLNNDLPIVECPTQPAPEGLSPPAPLVQPHAAEAEIQDEYFRNLGSALKTPDGPAANVTLCVLILKNGFVIVGKSACVNRANFNEETGKRLAREDALKQVTPFLGWRMADRRLELANQVTRDYRFG
jgi:putative intracellular protease/amidase